MTRTGPGRALAGRFVAGDAVSVAEQLNSEGLSVSLDLLGEEVHDEESALQATEDYLDCLDRIAQSSLDANVSVKPTQLGLPIDAGLPIEAIDRLSSRANEVGTTVTLKWRTRGTPRPRSIFLSKARPRMGI